VIERLTGRLELENVGFRYGSGGAWVLRGVSLRIEPREHAVFVGPSGQGKSTLLRLIAGLLQPSEGRVLLDGVDIRQYASASLSRYVGSLVGEPLVLADSVHNNLTLRWPEAPAAAVERAARASCFAEVVARMPRGYESPLEARGANLSGGERQRLGLAQALLGEPSMLFLDEATCSLDAATESRVLDNLLALHATLVSVAHRPAVIQRAHRVFEVADGRVTLRRAAPPGATSPQRSRGHLTLLRRAPSSDSSRAPTSDSSDATHPDTSLETPAPERSTARESTSCQL
jgi:ABC-type bacteriocin/lantibiotic exporter with double-glycine peptidase domain